MAHCTRLSERRTAVDAGVLTQPAGAAVVRAGGQPTLRDAEAAAVAAARFVSPVGKRTPAPLKTVTIVGTGGTIAGTGSPSSPAYDPAKNGVGEVVAEVKDAAKLAQVRCEQMRDPQLVTADNPNGFVNLNSSYITERQWLLLACQVQEAADRSDAVIVTHGTDTLEETAFFLQFTVKTDKPIIVVGAGRPTFVDDGTGKKVNPNNDGVANIRDALRVAADPGANGNDVMVVMNGKIHAAYDVWKIAGMPSKGKTNDMFASPTWWGGLGTIVRNRVHWRRDHEDLRERYHGFKVDLRGVEALPAVPVLTQQIGSSVLENVARDLARGVHGFVFAGNGQGALTEETVECIKGSSPDVAMVNATRVPAEVVRLTDEVGGRVRKPNALGSGSLSWMHAKIFVQLALLRISQDPSVPGETLRDKVRGLMERTLIYQPEP